jgi:hypothetical protein
MGSTKNPYHPMGEKNNKRRSKMMLLGKMDQVTLKKSEEDVSGRMGLSWIEHSMRHYGLHGMLDRRMPVSGESNREIAASRKVMAGVLSLIAGAQRVEDIEVLRADRGLLNSMGWKSMISPDTLLEYARVKDNAGKLRKSQEEFVVKAMRQSDLLEFTYDGDATYFDSAKDSATYSYQMKKQYSGMLGFIAELGICNTMDFRPGNVSPQTGVLNQLRKAVKQAKVAGKRISRARFDSAGHQNNVFECCEEEKIHFYISLDKNAAVMECIHALQPKVWQEPEEIRRYLGTESGVGGDSVCDEQGVRDADDGPAVAESSAGSIHAGEILLSRHRNE